MVPSYLSALVSKNTKCSAHGLSKRFLYTFVYIHSLRRHTREQGACKVCAGSASRGDSRGPTARMLRRLVCLRPTKPNSGHTFDVTYYPLPHSRTLCDTYHRLSLTRGASAQVPLIMMSGYKQQFTYCLGVRINGVTALP